MVFIVATPAFGSSDERLLSLSEEVLREIETSHDNQCPLVDLAVSLLVATWRYTPGLRPVCVAHGKALIGVSDISPDASFNSIKF